MRHLARGRRVEWLYVLDFTTYFETLPADRFDLAFRIEADRMAHAVFDPKKSSPSAPSLSASGRAMRIAALFAVRRGAGGRVRVHGYHHEVIGDLCDLQTMTRAQLFEHYKTYYAPNNAVAWRWAISRPRRIETNSSRVRKIKPGPALPQINRQEPPQKGERRVTVEGDGTTAYVEAAYHAPLAVASDFPALVVLDAILAGASSLAVFGGGGRTPARGFTRRWWTQSWRRCFRRIGDDG